MASYNNVLFEFLAVCKLESRAVRSDVGESRHWIVEFSGCPRGDQVRWVFRRASTGYNWKLGVARFACVLPVRRFIITLVALPWNMYVLCRRDFVIFVLIHISYWLTKEEVASYFTSVYIKTNYRYMWLHKIIMK